MRKISNFITNLIPTNQNKPVDKSNAKVQKVAANKQTPTIQQSHKNSKSIKERLLSKVKLKNNNFVSGLKKTTKKELTIENKFIILNKLTEFYNKFDGLSKNMQNTLSELDKLKQNLNDNAIHSEELKNNFNNKFDYLLRFHNSHMQRLMPNINKTLKNIDKLIKNQASENNTNLKQEKIALQKKYTLYKELDSALKEYNIDKKDLFDEIEQTTKEIKKLNRNIKTPTQRHSTNYEYESIHTDKSTPVFNDKSKHLNYLTTEIDNIDKLKLNTKYEDTKL